MKNILAYLFFLLMLSSCITESFKTINPAKFNAKIAARTDITTAEELMKIYYAYPPEESTPMLDIKSKSINDNLTEITLIHDRLQDDSQRALKIVMLAKQKDKAWFVEEIKQNWKCYEGRGHTNWGIELCN